jgi:hypothetical protein
VSDIATGRQVLEHLGARWYRGEAGLDDLVAGSPMVEVTFDAVSRASPDR